jgi:cytidine deaminase
MRPDGPDGIVTPEVLARLGDAAWKVREHAFVMGPTKVGCAVLADTGSVHVGANVEHRFRSHDVHAEVNALTNMAASGERKVVALVIAAERERFTPCGACLDWIFQFGGAECVVGFQSERGGEIATFLSGDLMPYYPH